MMKWFKHDSNAHTDAKIEKVLMRYGAEGYALYWYCIELIAGKVERSNVTFELEHDAELLGFKLKIDSIRVEEIMKYMIDLKLFESSDGRITCLKIAKRLDSSMTGSPEMRRIISELHTDNVMTCHDGVMMISDSVSTEEKRIEENRREEKTVTKRKRFSPPSKEELSVYAKEKRLNVSGFLDYYNSNGWLVGKNKMKCWKAAASGWSRRQTSYGNTSEVMTSSRRAI